MHSLPTLVHGKGSPPLQLPVVVPEAHQVQRVNDQPLKDSILLFSIYFISKWGETLEKLHFLIFGSKQYFYLTHLGQEYFEKLAFKKNKNCNFRRLYLKSWGKFRVKIKIFRTLVQYSSKSSCFLNVLSTRFHARVLRPVQHPVLLPVDRGLKELMMCKQNI